jgi:hypothetical protein
VQVLVIGVTVPFHELIMDFGFTAHSRTCWGR